MNKLDHSAPTGEVELPVVKTWQERMQEEFGPDTSGWKPDAYMIGEIKDLRAALRAYGQRAAVAVPSVQQFITQLETAERGFMCPLCGKDYPHEHTPAEITIYRNGCKYGARQQKLAGAEHQSVTEDAGLDAGPTGAGGGAGAHQRDEHRSGQAGDQRPDGGRDGARDGVQGSGEVREAVAAPSQPQQEAVPTQCTNSDVWNCKYCRKAETCEALKDPRNFGRPVGQPQQEAVPAEPSELIPCSYRIGPPELGSVKIDE